MLAICAAIQVLGHWYETSSGERVDGVGMLDVTTSPQAARTIGELVSRPLLAGLTQRLTGFENHRGGTVLGPAASPLGAVVKGAGNRAGDGFDGAVQGSVVATYMHGPCLARNPELADLLLSKVVGELSPLRAARSGAVAPRAAGGSLRRSRLRSKFSFKHPYRGMTAAFSHEQPAPRHHGSHNAARIVGLAAVLSAAAGPVVAFAGAAHGRRADGMHGDPVAAAPYWRHQQQDYDCAEMAVADVVGQITGHEPTEGEITAAAGNIPSVSHPGPIYRPSGYTKNSDLSVLLAHYGVQAAAVHTNTDALAQDLDQGRKVIVGVNDKTIWNKPGDRTQENHFVVVTGIDTKAGVVHLNDSGSKAGRDEQVSIATFEQAWKTSDNFAVVTSDRQQRDVCLRRNLTRAPPAAVVYWCSVAGRGPR